MNWFWATLQLALAAGLATTFDDNIYLTGFFAEVNRTFQPRHVVVGELLGFTALILIGLLGHWIGLAIPQPIIGLLGLLPILIGLLTLLRQWRQWRGSERSDREISALRFRDLRGFESRQPSLWSVLVDRQTYKVSMVTISNGSNNLSIYIPLFASLSASRILVLIPVFYGFVISWLFLSYHLTRAPGMALLLNRYAPSLFPFILIWLGARILADSGSLTLLSRG
ncbi:MAG: cadmium resistance transporter [Cyanobacteriota bacterium]|nr:cadmium resistance transporter [Cyanobacteriota bacterium]